MKKILFAILILTACEQKSNINYLEFKKDKELRTFLNTEKIVDLSSGSANIIFLYPGFCGACNKKNVQNIQTKLKFEKPYYIIVANTDSVNISKKLSELPNTTVLLKNEEDLAKQGLMMAEDVIIYYEDGKNLGYEPLANYADKNE